MHRVSVQLALVLAVSGLTFFLNLGQARLWDRDEPRNAGAASEMAARGDWIVPTFNDELRAQKPILTYWIMLAAYAVFGESEFAARFGSAALSIGTVIWTWVIARRLLGASRALWPPLALATFLMFTIAARAATPDAPLVFCFTSAIGLWILSVFAPNTDDAVRTFREPGLREAGLWFPRHLKWVVPIYACFGLAVLAKGPVGLVLPLAIIGMFQLLARLDEASPQSSREGTLAYRLRIALRPWHPVHFARTTWSMRPITGLATTLLVAAPWYLWVGLNTQGDFLEAFFLRENLGRATTAMENHSGGVWFYPVALLVGTFPWSVLALPLIIAVDRGLSVKRDERPLVLVLGLCWVGLVIVAFTLASTKLPSYITPCHAGAALVYGWYAASIASASCTLSARWKIAVASVFGIVAVALAVAVWTVAGELAPSLRPLSALAIIPLLGAAAVLLSLRFTQPRWVPVSISITSIVWTAAIFGIGSVQVDRVQQMDELLAGVRGRESVQLASFGKLESSWVYYAGHPILELDPAETNHVVVSNGVLEREHPWSTKPRPTLETFLQLPGEHFVIVPRSHQDQILGRARGRLVEIASVREFLNDDTLVLLGPPQVDRSAWMNDPSVQLR